MRHARKMIVRWLPSVPSAIDASLSAWPETQTFKGFLWHSEQAGRLLVWGICANENTMTLITFAYSYSDGHFPLVQVHCMMERHDISMSSLGRYMAVEHLTFTPLALFSCIWVTQAISAAVESAEMHREIPPHTHLTPIPTTHLTCMAFHWSKLMQICAILPSSSPQVSTVELRSPKDPEILQQNGVELRDDDSRAAEQQALLLLTSTLCRVMGV